MKRLHIQKGIAELRQLSVDNWNDLSFLQELLEELAHRKTHAARSLMSEILVQIDRIDQQSKLEEDFSESEVQTREDDRTRGFERNYEEQLIDSQRPVTHEFSRGVPNRSYTSKSRHSTSTRSDESFGSKTAVYGNMPDDRERPDQLTSIRPLGTTGLPDEYVRPFKREVSLDVSANADLPERFIAALQELIHGIKKTGDGQQRYELEKGRRAGVAGGDTLYSFPFADEAELFEDAQIEVQFDKRRIEGTIVSIGAGHLILALKDDIGDDVSFAVLLIDATALLEALKEKIDAANKGEISLNRTLADAVVRPGTLPKVPDDPIRTHRSVSLNNCQREAYEKALVEAVTFIWGPPGCGKTRTLGEIVRSAFEGGKRTLICSNTNKAVDQVLYQICKALGREHVAMEEGRIVRLGRVADDKLKSEFYQFVTVEGIVERRSADLESEKRQIEADIARIDSDTENARQCLAKFDSLDQAEQRVATERENVNKLSREGKVLQNELPRISARRDELIRELERRRNAVIGLFRRSEKAIQADIQRNATERQRIETHIKELKVRYAPARQLFEQAQITRNDLRRDVTSDDRLSAQSIVDEAKPKREASVAKLGEVEAKITEIREATLREAAIIGATCTKAYLSQKDIGQVDLVIIDEASMVIMPVAWFSAGLARERVVISGDFRQVPPIVPTDQEAIFEVLAQDPFTATNRTKRGVPGLTMLNKQYRMNSEICDLVAGRMYERDLSTAENRQTVPGRLPPTPFDLPLTIIDTSQLWPFESQNAFFSRFNMLHALLARNLAWHFRQNGVIDSNRDLGICTPYSAQARLIQKLLEGDGLDQYVHSGTVHRFQGDERRIVLLEIPESHGGFWALGQFIQGVPPNQVGARLINVAVSRAQEHLVVLANLTYLDRRLPSLSLLRGILYEMQEKGRIVSGEEILGLRPIDRDLTGLVGQIALDEVAENIGVFDEKQFERGLVHDIQAAKDSVVLFSGYVTSTRVAKLGDLLRSRISAGVKVRCVTRPPKLNGSIPEPVGREALQMLEGIGAVVDYRAKIHQKVCLIDNEIVWWGSVNALSHMGHADEMMTRTVNGEFAKIVATHMCKRPISAPKAQTTVAEAENPRCERCDGHSVLKDGQHGLYFECELRCGWKRNMHVEMRRTRSHGGSGERSRASNLPDEGSPCPDCGAKTRLQQGRFGQFYSCVRYPECNGTVNVKPATGTRRTRSRSQSGRSRARY